MLEESDLEIVSAIREYWDSHTLGFQYVTENTIEIGCQEFFDHIRPWMAPFKFPWIMARIKNNAALLEGKRLLEIGCGLGFCSIEFAKRGVNVTATDLSPRAVELTRKHFYVKKLNADDICVENVLELSFSNNTFDAVWANGVLHHTGNIKKALEEIRRVLKPGGRAIISHFYRRPSWMYFLSRLGKENIEFKELDPPVTEFCKEEEILSFFDGFSIIETVREHCRALPVARKGLKAWLYRLLFRPLYNLLPIQIAEKLAYKFSIIAIKT